MSERWAAIVYGRTYHLDFRFITIPHDFTAEDLNWASEHIVATTRQARKLAGSPRWSLFKNARFCVVGVTATVKDLIGNTAKDDRGRPLYIFVGYVAQLSSQQKIANLPAYSANLDNFKILYQEIEPVWLVKNYDPASRQPKASQYDPIAFDDSVIAIDNFREAETKGNRLTVLNRSSKYPQKIYLWPSLAHQNKLLWQTSSQCPDSTSICLNIQGKALINSPFLNLSSSQTEQFQILDRVAPHYHPNNSTEVSELQNSSLLSQKISDRAKDDIDLTLQQATKMAIAGQEIINHLADWNQPSETEAEELEPNIDDPEFGFKTKKSTPPKEDWF